MPRGSRLLLPLIVAVLCAPGILTATPPDSMAMQVIDTLPYYAVTEIFGDADRDGNPEMYLLQPTFGLPYALEHTGNNVFEPHSLGEISIAPWQLGDIDRDGKADLVGQTYGLLQVLEARDSWSFPDSVVWVDTAEGTMSMLACIMDLDCDSAWELCWNKGSGSQLKAVYECTGDNQYEFRAWLRDSLPARPVNQVCQTWDLDQDGRPELLASGGGLGCVMFYESPADDSFEMVWYQRIGSSDCVFGAASTRDMDGDGLPEAITFAADWNTGTGTVFVLEAVENDSFEIRWSTGVAPASTGHSTQIATGDIDGDSIPEFALTTGSHVRLFRCTGNDQYEEIWNTPCIYEPIGLYDVNSDGRCELVHDAGHKTIIWGWLPVSVEEQQRAVLDAVQVRPSVVSRGGVVRLDGLADGTSVAVLDASGRVVRVTSEDVVQTRGLSVGMYFLRLTAGRSAVLKKLLVVE